MISLHGIAKTTTTELLLKRVLGNEGRVDPCGLLLRTVNFLHQSRFRSCDKEKSVSYCRSGVRILGLEF